jgi:hypothetical protein
MKFLTDASVFMILLKMKQYDIFYLFNYLSKYLSMYLSIYLSIYISIYLSISGEIWVQLNASKLLEVSIYLTNY